MTTATATEAVTTLHSLTIVRNINASRERVFAAWTDPTQLAQWFKPSPDFTSTASNDLRRGGDFKIQLSNKAGKAHNATGKYMEILPPERLVFTWSWVDDRSADGSLITVLLRDLGNNSTELTFTHSMLPTAESAQKHTQGWTGCLNQCQLFLDPNAEIQQTAPHVCS